MGWYKQQNTSATTKQHQYENNDKRWCYKMIWEEYVKREMYIIYEYMKWRWKIRNSKHSQEKERRIERKKELSFVSCQWHTSPHDKG